MAQQNDWGIDLRLINNKTPPCTPVLHSIINIINQKKQKVTDKMTLFHLSSTLHPTLSAFTFKSSPNTTNSQHQPRTTLHSQQVPRSSTKLGISLDNLVDTLQEILFCCDLTIRCSFSSLSFRSPQVYLYPFLLLSHHPSRAFPFKCHYTHNTPPSP